MLWTYVNEEVTKVIGMINKQGSMICLQYGEYDKHVICDTLKMQNAEYVEEQESRSMGVLPDENFLHCSEEVIDF